MAISYCKGRSFRAYDYRDCKLSQIRVFGFLAHRNDKSLHCEKSLFVLASHQKIPVLRTENPAVDTRTICLLPIQFFYFTHARKATAGKSRPKTTDTAGKFGCQ
jgi:hypothetical protein